MRSSLTYRANRYKTIIEQNRQKTDHIVFTYNLNKFLMPTKKKKKRQCGNNLT